MARIIKEAGVKNAIAEIFKETRNTNIVIEENDSEAVKKAKTEAINKKQEEAGFEAIMTIFESCSTEKLEKMLYEFLGGISEKKSDEVAGQTLEATIEDIKTIVSENNIVNFFKQADQLTK